MPPVFSIFYGNVYRLFSHLTTDPEPHVTLKKVVETSSPLAFLPLWALILLAITCLITAAIVAGLTLGLMSLDTTGLQIMSRSLIESEREAAVKILPLRKRGNLLLVTLLLANTVATELLPLVLETIQPGGYFSLIASVVLVMLFGEIFPQAICSRNALQIGAFFVPFVKVLRVIFYPIAGPIAFALDWALGEELGTVYTRDELKELIQVHSRSKHGVLTDDETTILKGTLDFALKTVKHVMTKEEDVFMLNIDETLSWKTFNNILKKGHSRVPLYCETRENVVALLLTKQLLLVDPDDNIPLRALLSKRKRNYKIRVLPPILCSEKTLLSDLLNEFQIGRSHMAIVYDDITKPEEKRKLMGIVTLEDIIEEIIQEEIIDETDVFLDNQTHKPVLVRGKDGKLVRALSIGQPSEGTKNMIMKDVDLKKLKKQKSNANIIKQARIQKTIRRVSSTGLFEATDSRGDLLEVVTHGNDKNFSQTQDNASNSHHKNVGHELLLRHGLTEENISCPPSLNGSDIET